ncbi:hypothetical protein KY290_008995 [Solanum tuberosum]|uniref:Heat shock protein 70 (HSP70)-interacting protein n=1 Tax=Solanum tuberosum TaxID=4113 RepID=A0ABQ7UR67_SOLTU|nr:hypothetical protein KY285_022759 [Solanum tuberosum]KAH0753744.1 hypothetical protein KY290_024014 [Solanum tuberosum]KAH0777584.1 hypothetical protein KY290_008995 [Solanum tuberosum]
MPIQRKNWLMSALSRKTSMNPLIAILEALHFHQLQSLRPVERSLILKSKGKFSALHCSFRFEEAENDCTEALNLDDRYIKAYSRHSTTTKELGKLKESIEDAEFALRLEPQNPQTKKQYGEVKAL